MQRRRTLPCHCCPSRRSQLTHAPSHTHTTPLSLAPTNHLAGVSGAGRSAKEPNLYTEVAEGIHSYGVSKHRHMPEIEQGLTDAAGKEVKVSFTPHLMPMSRCGGS